MMSQMMPSQVGFLPTRISNLEAWWAADRSEKTFNGSNVSQINDLSGNGHNAVQATATRQPLFVENSNINGIPALRYDGTSDFLEMTGLNGIINADYSIAFMTKANSNTGAFPCVISWDVDKTLYQYRADGTFSIFDGAVKILNSNDLRNQVISQLMIADSSNMTCYTNGIEQNTISYSPVAGATATFIGMELDGATPSNLYNDDISEIMIYDKKLSVTELGFLNVYMTRRAGI